MNIHLIHGKRDNEKQWEKLQSFQKVVLNQFYTHMEKYKTSLLPHIVHSEKLKVDQKVKSF